MADATVVVLVLSTLGALYRWPDLRPVTARLLRWFGGSFLALLALTILCIVVADVEALQKRSPLYTAAQAGNHPRVVELLQYQHVRSDIDVGKRSGFGMLASDTPLQKAAFKGRTEVVAALLKAGANPSTPATLGLGMLGSITPLFAAAQKGRTEVVAELLKAGADPSTPATLGLGMLGSITPLSAAARFGHTEVVAELLKAGANPNTPGTFGLGMLFSATPGFFFGGGGLSSAALIKWRNDAAEPLSDGHDKQSRKRAKLEARLAAQQDASASISGWLKRYAGWTYGWKLAEAEIRGNVLLLRNNAAGAAQATASVFFGDGKRFDAVPLKGATVDVGKQQDGDSDELDPIVVTTRAGERETLYLPTADARGQWINAIRHAAKGSSIMRRVVEVAFPSTWEAPFEQPRLIELSKGTPEYDRVAKLAYEQQFKPGVGQQPYVKGKLKVNSVSRIQAPHIWEQYCLRRSIIASENEGDPEEKHLWHGTPVPHLIVKDGFDPRVCALNGLFGGGVYFADKSTKSLRYAGASSPGDKGTLILCRVALGRPMIKWYPQSDMRRPPDPFPLFGWQHLMMWLDGSKFHSVMAEAGMSLLMNEYIVYHTNQAFPEYLITFELKK